MVLIKALYEAYDTTSLERTAELDGYVAVKSTFVEGQNSFVVQLKFHVT